MYEEIIYFSEKLLDIPFNLQMCGYSYCDGTYRIRRHCSEIYCIEYIIKGHGYVQNNDRKFVASQGDVYILPAGTNHIYYSDTADPWEKVWFNINGDFIKNTLKAYKLEDIDHIKNVDIRSYFDDFIKTAKEIKNKELDTWDFSQCAADFLKIVQRLHEHIYVNEESSQEKNNARLLKNKIDTIIDYSLTFEEIIDEFHTTKSHLIRQFKAEYGITPYNYLLNKKTNAAKTLLVNTTMSITQISEYLGMNDAHYFSNFFKNRTGISPSSFRKKNYMK